MVETYSVECGDRVRSFGPNAGLARAVARRLSLGPTPAYVLAAGPLGKRVVDRYTDGLRQDIQWEAA